MARGCSAKIVAGDMQVDLRAGDQPVAEQIPDGDQAHPGAHQMRGESVPPMSLKI